MRKPSILSCIDGFSSCAAKPFSQFRVYGFVVGGMMKRLLGIAAITALAVAAWAISHRGVGHGVVEGGSFAGAHFDFFVQQPPDPNHPNRFRFFDEGMFIPVDIEMQHIPRIGFEQHAVHFSGRGTYNQSTQVTISVSAFDGGRAGHDRFRMVARDDSGNVVHSADGNVIEGDVAIHHMR
jgi:hypothetical protein